MQQNQQDSKMHILVIEDTQKHLDDAKKFFEAHPEVEVDYACAVDDAMNYLGLAYRRGSHRNDSKVRDKVDGVISDVYFPVSSVVRTDPEAAGVVVALICREKGIPCVLNTAGWHHGSKYQWIHHLALDGFFPYMVDVLSPDNEEDEAETKNWKKAFRILSELITESAKSLATESS